jgi:phage gp29-like protein
LNESGQSQFNQARIEWAIRLRYSPMPRVDPEYLATLLNAFRIGDLRNIGKVWEIMMERDGELRLNAGKRASDLAGQTWSIVDDGSADGKAHADALKYFYENLRATAALDQDVIGGVDLLLKQLATAHSHYYSAHEMIMRVDNAAQRHVTAEFRHTPIWFFESRRGYLAYLPGILDLYGQPCLRGEWLTCVGEGWMRPLCMAFCTKMFTLRDWQIWCLRYAGGFLEGIVDEAPGSQGWQDAKSSLETLANDGAVLHSPKVVLKFLEQQAGKGQAGFEPLVEMVNRLYAKCYRGVDLATGSRMSSPNGGGNAVGASVQQEESGIFLADDLKWANGILHDRVDRPIIAYLFNQEPRAKFVLQRPDDDTSAADLAAAQVLIPLGLPIAITEAQKRFNWPAPQPGEPCLAAPVQAAPGEPGEPAADPDRTPAPPAAAPATPLPPVKESPKVPTQPAQGAEDPIGAGAIPEEIQTEARGLPDPQVDATGFWNGATGVINRLRQFYRGKAPTKPDPADNPGPAFGYAIPNEAPPEVSEEFDAKSRALVAAAVHDDLAHAAAQIKALLEIDDPEHFKTKAAQLQAKWEQITGNTLLVPASADAIARTVGASYANGLQRGSAVANDNPNHDELGRFESGSGESKPVRSLDEVIAASKGKGKAHFEYPGHGAAELAVKKSTGIDISGMKHRVDADHLRHFEKAHGAGMDQHSSGAQEPLTEEDYKKIPEVTTHFDSVEKSQKKSRDGKEVILYKKRYNGHLLVMEEVRKKTGVLSAHSMRKEKAGLPSAKASGRTSETPSSNPNPSP